MTSFPLTLLVGMATGFFGAIPPGPLNITIIRKASDGRVRDAFNVAIGGALIDTLLCGLIGLGFSGVIEGVVTNQWVKGVLCLFLIGYALKILIVDRKRDAAREASDIERRAEEAKEDRETKEPKPAAIVPFFRLPFLVGLLQGAANPTLFVNWTFVISFFVGHHIIRATRPSAAAFALGVGLGVFGWFALLIEMLVRLKNHPIGNWLRRSTVLAGLLLLAFGIVFTVRTIKGL